MTIALSPAFGAGWQFFTDDGIPLAGGFLYSYAAGTTTPATTYTSVTGGTANANPIVLDASGRVPEQVWITIGSSYKFILKDALYTQIWEKDNISVYTGVDPFIALANNSNPALGDNMIGYRQSNAAGLLTGAVGKTVHDKLQEFVSVKDFGAVGDGTTDDTAALVLALKAGRNVHFPAGTYKITTCVELVNMNGWSMTGDGIGVSTIIADATGAGFTAPRILMFYIDNCDRWTISGITFNVNRSTAFVNDPSDTMYVTLCDLWTISDCEFIYHPRMAFYALSVNYFTLKDCFFYHYAPGVNTYNFNIDSVIADGVKPELATDSTYGVVSGNTCIGASNQVRGQHIAVLGNFFTGSKHGCGILAGGSYSSGDGKEYWGWYLIANNTSIYNSGRDATPTHVRGLEVAGAYNIIANNILNQNGGVGLMNFGRWATITGNTCCGNGVNIATHPTMDKLDRSGISLYQDATLGANGAGASFCTIVGNSAYDLGADTQWYNYSEQTHDMEGVVLASNQFYKVAAGGTAVYIQSLKGYYETQDWIPWTCTVTSDGGALTSWAVDYAVYKLSSQKVEFQIRITVTTKGAGTNLICTIPPILFGAKNDQVVNAILLDGAASAVWPAYVHHTSGKIYAEGTIADGKTYVISGWYQTEG
jgi:hypothetical protein